jgi:hypothetical protein
MASAMNPRKMPELVSENVWYVDLSAEDMNAEVIDIIPYGCEGDLVIARDAMYEIRKRNR